METLQQQYFQLVPDSGAARALRGCRWGRAACSQERVKNRQACSSSSSRCVFGRVCRALNVVSSRVRTFQWKTLVYMIFQAICGQRWGLRPRFLSQHPEPSFSSLFSMRVVPHAVARVVFVCSVVFVILYYIWTATGGPRACQTTEARRTTRWSLCWTPRWTLSRL